MAIGKSPPLVFVVVVVVVVVVGFSFLTVTHCECVYLKKTDSRLIQERTLH